MLHTTEPRGMITELQLKVEIPVNYNNHMVYRLELATHYTNVNPGKKYNIRITYGSSYMYNYANKTPSRL